MGRGFNLPWGLSCQPTLSNNSCLLPTHREHSQPDLTCPCHLHESMSEPLCTTVHASNLPLTNHCDADSNTACVRLLCRHSNSQLPCFGPRLACTSSETWFRMVVKRPKQPDVSPHSFS
ncbi:Uncharacterized protein HZ326_10926 [Fusarium oxysporum f. sp. albedinis]|nr:Uncharacterized protein HZ326_10926 [Fusarium oxysporum f. sp. albedinis]